MSLGEVTRIDEEDVDVMLAVTRLAYATSDISREVRRTHKGHRSHRGRRASSKGMQDRVLRIACQAMEGFVCGGDAETPERLEVRVHERVTSAMPWIFTLLLRHLVSWAISFIINWLIRDLTAKDD